jgi:hypothetical protein
VGQDGLGELRLSAGCVWPPYTDRVVDIESAIGRVAVPAATAGAAAAAAAARARRDCNADGDTA